VSAIAVLEGTDSEMSSRPSCLKVLFDSRRKRASNIAGAIVFGHTVWKFYLDLVPEAPFRTSLYWIICWKTNQWEI